MAERTGASSATRPAVPPAAGATAGMCGRETVTPPSAAVGWTATTVGGVSLPGDAAGEVTEDAADAAVAATAGAVPVTDGGAAGAGACAGATTGEGAGGDGGRTVTGAGAEPGAGAASGAVDGAGAGAALGGSSPSGSTYPSSSDARRIPRWTLGPSCSGVPLTPIVPTVSPSPTVAPFAISIVPRWTSVTA